MKRLLTIICSARIARSALRVALVVGTVLNAVNQGGAMLAGDRILWLNVLLNYLVPYCVASYSAAKNEMTRNDDE